MKKKLTVIVLTALVFISAVVLGVSSVFRVRSVSVQASKISEVAEEEASAIQKRIQELYMKDSIFFAEEEKAKEVLAEFPHFRMISFKKDFPNRLVISIAEDAEVYAVEVSETEYYILGADGMVLDKRDTPKNRLDNASNVVLKGLEASGEKGEVLNGGETLSTLLYFLENMAGPLNGLRDNIQSVQILPRSPEYRIVTREGVVLYVGQPQELTKTKAERLVNEYLALEDDQRLTGCILLDSVGDQIICSYQSKDIMS